MMYVKYKGPTCAVMGFSANGHFFEIRIEDGCQLTDTGRRSTEGFIQVRHEPTKQIFWLHPYRTYEGAADAQSKTGRP